MFNPTEIIFATTQACNLHCPHCFVSRNPKKLEASDAITFLESCKGTDIYKIGLSYDNFHGQDFERIKVFAQAVNHIFGEESLNVQAVADPELGDKETEVLENQLNILAEDYCAEVYILPQTFQSADSRAWQSKKWFKEDYCEGPGQVLYIHPDGKIAPCCGFANENEQLFIGTIDEDFQTVMENARNNKLVKICYETGLSNYKKEIQKKLQKQNKKLPGKCRDMCSFCDFICKNFIP